MSTNFIWKKKRQNRMSSTTNFAWHFKGSYGLYQEKREQTVNIKTSLRSKQTTMTWYSLFRYSHGFLGTGFFYHFLQGRQLFWLPVSYSAHQDTSEKGSIPQVGHILSFRVDTLTLSLPKAILIGFCKQRRSRWDSSYEPSHQDLRCLTFSF